MKKTIAVLSDVHGNLEALHAVMKSIKKYNPDEIICLGDIVGYGPNPCECLDILINMPNIKIIMGNHEDILLGNISQDICSSIGKISSEWNKEHVCPKYIKDIKNFKRGISYDNIGFYHSCPKGKYNYPYLNKLEDLISSFSCVESQINFYGHTHRPRITCINGDKIYDSMIMSSTTINLNNNTRYYINVGSVGQQRDTQTDSSFAILKIMNDNILLGIERVNYDSYKTFCKIKELIKSDEIATYLIREQGRREEYENSYNRS